MAVSLGQKSGRTKNEVNAERIPQYSVLSLATGGGGIRVNLCPTPQVFILISFPEATCLLVSTEKRSPEIINNLVPRALVSLAFKI